MIGENVRSTLYMARGPPSKETVPSQELAVSPNSLVRVEILLRLPFKPWTASTTRQLGTLSFRRRKLTVQIALCTYQTARLGWASAANRRGNAVDGPQDISPHGELA